MKNKELIAALQKLNPEATVLINIKQSNKVYGRQLKVESTQHHGYEHWVDASYSGCTITVHLPGKAFISNWPKED